MTWEVEVELFIDLFMLGLFAIAFGTPIVWLVW
jgi:hypothetical protein